MKTLQHLGFLVGCSLGFATLAATSRAAIITNAPAGLPADAGYVADTSIAFANGVVLEDLVLSNFHNAIEANFPDEDLISFDGTLTGTLSNSSTGASAKTRLDFGQAKIRRPRDLSDSRLQVNSPPGPIEIRTSLTLPSEGLFIVTPAGSGQFSVDGFFDVFVEISLDGGPFVPQLGGPTHLELQSLVPKPSGLALAALGLAGLAMWRTKRRSDPRP